MKVKILKEEGYEQSALGFSLSYNITLDRAKEILPKFAFGKPGENKFLESMMIWIDVTAPRFWWSEFDTYRVGVTKQSESTMHTLKKQHLVNSDFEYQIPESWIDLINDMIDHVVSIDKIKAILPEGFLQRRIVCTNYKTLQNIYIQRHDHKLNEWHTFISEVISQINHSEFIKGE